MPLAFGDAALDTIAAEHPAGSVRAAAEREALGIDHADAGARIARASQIEEAVENVIAFHHGGPSGNAIPTPEVACVIIADEVIGLASRPEPDYRLLGPALEALGLCDEDFDDLALEAVRGGKSGAATAAGVAKLEREARVDDLTGVLNRRHWLATIRWAVDQREAGSVLVCDIDHFKSVNDGHGHATGDLVLTEVARHLAAQGTAGRLGGDEFAVWVGGPPEQGEAAAHAILQAVACAFAGEQIGPEVGISIGTASPESDAESLSLVLSRADEALYEAKRTGRGRVVRY